MKKLAFLSAKRSPAMQHLPQIYHDPQRIRQAVSTLTKTYGNISVRVISFAAK